MKITFAGVGSAFTTQEYYQSSFVLEKNNKKLVVDCGTDARFSLGELGVTNTNLTQWIDAVYITHLHADHCGGLEFLAFCSYFNANKKRIKMFLHEDLVDDLWSIMRPGLTISEKNVSLDTFFDVNVVKDSFSWQDINFDLIKAEHCWSGDKLMPVYGLLFNSVYYTADTISNDATVEACKDANVIFHDCETTPFKSGVHAHYTDLVNLPENIKSKMWLYHYSPNPAPIPEKDGFLGFVKKGMQLGIL